jgi:hypothetical protein
MKMTVIDKIGMDELIAATNNGTFNAETNRDMFNAAIIHGTLQMFAAIAEWEKRNEGVYARNPRCGFACYFAGKFKGDYVFNSRTRPYKDLSFQYRIDARSGKGRLYVRKLVRDID